MTRRKKFAIAALVVLGAFIVLLGYGVKIYREFSRDMNARYATLNTIGNVLEYVETHNGRWPTNWDEIEPFPGAREFVVVQFEVDIDRLVAEPEAIKSTIVPAYGRYNHLLGHDAERLRQKLIEHHRPKARPTASATPSPK